MRGAPIGWNTRNPQRASAGIVTEKPAEVLHESVSIVARVRNF